MTLLLPTCERVTDLLTAYEEGVLGPFDWFGLRLHLAVCPPCRAFLEAFERTPALLRSALDGGPTAAGAESALAGALAALQAGRLPRGPRHHPAPEDWAALAPGGDGLLALLLRVHLGHCEACREAHGPEPGFAPDGDPLGGALRAQLPPEAQWRWHRWGLGGGRAASLCADATTGATLSLAVLPGGRTTPRHDHPGAERAVILCGGLQDGPAHLRAGDWITHGPGELHGPTADPGGECWALIALERPVRFLGWRAVFN